LLLLPWLLLLVLLVLLTMILLLLLLPLLPCGDGGAARLSGVVPLAARCWCACRLPGVFGDAGAAARG